MSATSEEPESNARSGFTFEANVGLGITDGPAGSEAVNPEAVGIGVGRWVTPKLAVMLRFAGHTVSESIYRRYNGVASLGLQYWVADRVWIGGGLGVGGVGYVISQGETTGDLGYGADLRAGVMLSRTNEHAIDVSIEVTPVRIHELNDLDRATYTGMALMLGYQHL